MILLRLFWEYFKTGLFAVGGGVATIPFLSDIADRTGWFTQQQLADMLAVAESTPGPIGVNMATYVGYTVNGIPGAIVATAGLIAPSLIIIEIIAAILSSFSDNYYVKALFKCLRPASVGLIICAGISVAKIVFLIEASEGSILNRINFTAVIMAVILFIFMQFVPYTKKLHPAVFIFASAAIGILIF